MTRFAPVWRVGFSGHRTVSNPALVESRLASIWNDLAVRVEGEFEAYASLAEGADIFFAESAAGGGRDVHLIFPFPIEEFVRDVSPEFRPRFDAALRGAASVEEGSFSRQRTEAFYACGIAVLDASDVMVFCWDGEKERGHGGTAQIVRAARERGVPLVWIHSETGEVRWENFPEGRLRDPLTEKLRHLTGSEAEAADREGSIDTVGVLDAVAARTAPRYRFFTTANIVVHVLAICIAVFGLKALEGDAKQAAAVVKAVLLLLTMALFTYVRYQRLHDAWLVCRVAAEIGRSFRACAGFLPLSALEQLLRPFGAYRRLARSLVPEARRRARSLPDLEARKTEYAGERLRDQERYFDRMTSRLARQNRVLAAGFWVCSLSGFLAAAAYVFWMESGILGVGTALLPVGAMMFLAILSVQDVDRRLARFREMRDEVRQGIRRVEAARDEAALVREVVVMEQCLLGEVGEWYRRTRHIHIH